MNQAARPALQITYDGLRPQQISEKWAAEAGGFEAYVFDGAGLAEEAGWQALRAGLRTVSALGVSELTCHFPTENADWVNDDHAYHMLLRFCDAADAAGARGVVLHANQFVQQEDWLRHDLSGTRGKVVERLAELDARLAGSRLWIGVENLPVIGAEGTDYDPVFVRPDDYLPLHALGSSRIGATWDICHWAVTYATDRAVAQLQRRPPEDDALALPTVPVKHIHFSSYTGLALPFTAGRCHEGVPPQDGDPDQEVLAAMVRAALAASDGQARVVLEVQEEDYENRVNCWRTRDWLLGRTLPAAARSVGTDIRPAAGVDARVEGRRP
ncbi:TIM barrel protein [Streptomyces sp. NPDC088789]|uniref:TIM barrel protein n=1 Tax=Streptomyces sp. NPDC088789 TaxID=3365899 RepID=UPI00381FD0DF